MDHTLKNGANAERYETPEQLYAKYLSTLSRNARTSRYETNTAEQWALKYIITPPQPHGQMAKLKGSILSKLVRMEDSYGESCALLRLAVYCTLRLDVSCTLLRLAVSCTLRLDVSWTLLRLADCCTLRLDVSCTLLRLAVCCTLSMEPGSWVWSQYSYEGAFHRPQADASFLLLLSCRRESSWVETMEPRWVYGHEVGWNQDGFMTVRLSGTKMGLWLWGCLGPKWVYNYEVGWSTVGGSRNCVVRSFSTITITRPFWYWENPPISWEKMLVSANEEVY
jgi:hypothetical protein